MEPLSYCRTRAAHHVGAPMFLQYQKLRLQSQVLPRGVRGIGKGLGLVSVSAPLERLPTLGFYLLSSLLLVARGIGWVSVIHVCQ